MAERKAKQEDAYTYPRTKHTPSTTTDRRATRSMTTDAARRAVFDTAELLELIILHLPMSNIFTSQRVSRQFRSIITTSPQIQLKLFLRTNNKSERWTMEHENSETFIRLQPDQTAAKVKTVPSRFNPYFLCMNERPRGYLETFCFWRTMGDCVCPFPRLGSAIIDSILNPSVTLSCQGMHIADGLVRAGHIWVHWDVAGIVHGSVIADFDVPGGATVRDLIECVKTPRRQDVDVREGERSFREVSGGRLFDVVEVEERKYGVAANWTFGSLCLHGIFVPHDSTRERVVNRVDQ